MKKTPKMDTILIISFIIALIYVGTTLIINTSKSCDVNINYNATFYAVDEINATEVVSSVKLACYELCVNELGGSDHFYTCMKSCDTFDSGD